MDNSTFNFPHYKVIAQAVGDLKPGNHYHFFTWGRWSMHEMLLYLLSFAGQSKVVVTSFSLSEFTIRAFAIATQAGYINRLNLLLNTAVKRNKTDLMFFANNVVNRIGLAHVHMKITLIEGENLSVVVNQSANSTLNPAFESGVICTDRQVIEQVYKPALELAFDKSMIINGINK